MRARRSNISFLLLLLIDAACFFIENEYKRLIVACQKSRALQISWINGR